MKPKYKITKRQVKHVFTKDEIANLNIEFGQSYDGLLAAEGELKSVTATYKAKVAEAEAKMTALRSTINAGFEQREKNVFVVLDLKAGKKFTYLESDLVDGELPKKAEPVITEAITDADRQQELIEAEAQFDARHNIVLFPPAGDDSGSLIIGRKEGKWFTALRVKIGTRVINERLDSEQPCSKKRSDQVNRALKRFSEWLVESMGREESKGFQNHIELVKAEQADKEE